MSQTYRPGEIVDISPERLTLRMEEAQGERAV